MDYAEIRTRAGQELHKRGDLLRYRLGMGPEVVRLGSGIAEGKFFFPRGEAIERARMVQERLPDSAAEIVREADEICRHRFRLLGYNDLDYGTEIDWHLDCVHGKQAPLDPWLKIPFLEFAAVGDHKVIWELNRHQHLVTLAKAWLLTKDEKYPRELMAQWHSWSKANPYPIGINWASTLEVAFRALSWIWVDQLLCGAPGLTSQYGEFRSELLPALAFHGRYIERYLSTYFSPNTHLLGETVAMFFLGSLYLQMPHAAHRQQEGWKIILHEAGRQVRPDGVYFEQSLHYHVYALDFFLYARVLAAANGLRIPAAYDETLTRMLNVVAALAQAGPAEGFGDDDGGRLFDPRRNRTEHMTDPLAIGALAFHRKDLGAQVTEESIWLFGECAVEALGASKPQIEAKSVAFPDGGLYVLADSQPVAQEIVIDAGPQGVGRCGHGHADALSLRLTMNGRRWLVDSGSGVYISSKPADRDALRGTSAHNTMRVDGSDQARAAGPFSWTDVPTTRAQRWVVGKTFTYFAGSHNGFTRLAPDPVTHKRYVVQVNDTLSLVRDVAVGSAEHDVEIRWHFESGLAVEELGPGNLLVSAPEAEQPALRMLAPSDCEWKARITRELVSPAYGCYQAVPVVATEVRTKLPAETAVALIAQKHASQTSKNASMVSTRSAGVQAYELQDGDHSHGFFFADDKQMWSLGAWTSDAEFLYYRTENEKLAQLIAIGGSSVSWQGQVLLARGSDEFFEWRRQDGSGDEMPEPFAKPSLFNQLRDVSGDSNATSSYAGQR